MLPLLAQEKPTKPAAPATPVAPPAATTATTTPTAEVIRQLEDGKVLMGLNNPFYAETVEKETPEARNIAGTRALEIFREVVKQYPQYADGWLWLGIALTETLRYTKDHPEGIPTATDEEITEGMQAFKTAHERSPTDLVYASYYGEGLMTYRRDFATAYKMWETFAAVAKNDMERTMAYVQAGRACLNLATFGKAEKKPDAEVRSQYQAAVGFIDKAAKLCPNAKDVKEMQVLLKQYRKSLLGK